MKNITHTKFNNISETKACKLLFEREEEAIQLNDIVRLQNIETYYEKLELLERYLNLQYAVIQAYYFKEYPDHGWFHAKRVMDFMIDIIKEPNDLTNLELILIIYVALLHDIGMAQTKEQGELLFPDKKISHRVVNYKKEHIDINEEEAKRLVRQAMIRGKHGELSEKIVNKIPTFEMKIDGKISMPWSDLFNLPFLTAQIDTRQIVGELCKSHTAPFINVNDGNDGTDFDCSFAYIAGLLRIADFLDVTCLRADEYYQSFHQIGGVSGTHYTTTRSLSAEVQWYCAEPCQTDCPNKENKCGKRRKQIHITINYPTTLAYDQKVQAMRIIRSFIGDLEKEIQDVIQQLNIRTNDSEHKICLVHRLIINSDSSRVPVKMEIEKLSVDFNMIKTIFSSNQLYKSKLCGLREIMQNAYDACKDFSEHSLSPLHWEPEIIIEVDESKDSFSISDNGIGMNEYIIREYFLTIGKSIYNYESKYVYDSHYRTHIGHFGLGFFAAFMLSSQVIVETFHRGSKAQRIELDINSKFVTLTNDTTITQPGTKVSLSLSAFQDALCKEFKTDDYKKCPEFLNKVKHYIRSNFLNGDIKIIIKLNGKILDPLNLSKVEITKGLSLNKKLVEIDAKAIVTNRFMPTIFFAKNADNLIKVNYSTLLRLLKGEQREIPYLNAGVFQVFSSDPIILNDFSQKATNRTDQHRNLNGKTRNISESINITIDNFWDQNSALCNGDKPTHCRYAKLTYVPIKRDHAALCERDVPCSVHRLAMLANDACGTAPLDDRIYIRHVLLPDLHVKLPYLNYRYSFDKLIANITTDDVYPTLPRDTLSDELCTELSQAIGKAIADSKDTYEDELISKTLYKDFLENTFYMKGDES